PACCAHSTHKAPAGQAAIEQAPAPAAPCHCHDRPALDSLAPATDGSSGKQQGSPDNLARWLDHAGQPFAVPPFTLGTLPQTFEACPASPSSSPRDILRALHILRC